MKLDEFIKGSLIDIANGVKGANAAIGVRRERLERGSTITHYPFKMWGDAQNGHGWVSFDVAVTVKSESTKEGGAGVRIWVVELGGEGSKTTASEAISRIQFQIQPVDIN